MVVQSSRACEGGLTYSRQPAECEGASRGRAGRIAGRRPRRTMSTRHSCGLTSSRAHDQAGRLLLGEHRPADDCVLLLLLLLPVPRSGMAASTSFWEPTPGNLATELRWRWEQTSARLEGGRGTVGGHGALWIGEKLVEMLCAARHAARGHVFTSSLCSLCLFYLDSFYGVFLGSQI